MMLRQQNVAASPRRALIFLSSRGSFKIIGDEYMSKILFEMRDQMDNMSDIEFENAMSLS